jgi:hypothetical protein
MDEIAGKRRSSCEARGAIFVPSRSDRAHCI